MSADIIQIPPNLQAVNRDVHLLCPLFAQKVHLALARCQELGYQVDIFEGWRSPQRQEYLWSQGRSRLGAIVTKARAWQSWHQFGLAIDIAYKIDGKWSWDSDFGKLVPFFKEQGLEWLGSNDPGHYQLTKGLNIDVAAGLMRAVGLQRVWQEVT
jgi:hypothetical protein